MTKKRFKKVVEEEFKDQVDDTIETLVPEKVQYAGRTAGRVKRIYDAY